jgi:hypothetical protein
MYMKSVKIILLASSLSVTTGTVQAAWSDFLGDVFDELTKPADKEDAGETSSQVLGNQEMIQAVLEALEVGTRRAIELLAKDGGYLNDQAVKILMPESLQQVDSLLRKLGQEKYADQFVASMNHAAERAVPKTTTIVIDAIKKMSLSDAKAILQGNDDAATQYLRQHTSEALQQAIQPIVSESMDEVGVTSAYKKMVDKADFLSSFMDKESLDIDRYVTEKTLDGLFLKLADEEARIRKDPLARSSDLLKKVFAEFAK